MPSVKQLSGGNNNNNSNNNMAYRGGNRNNRNFGGGNYGGGSQLSGGNRMNISPWESQNTGTNYGPNGGNMNQALNLANNLLNNFFRNQNPQSLLDLPRGSGSGGRSRSSGGMGNRSGGGGNRMNRRSRDGYRSSGGGGGGGSKSSSQKQGGGGGIRKQNALDRVRKVLAKNANKKKESTSGDKKSESRESLYANINNDMFYCHLCKKHMWDAISFENHIKGRAHLTMRDGIEESYRLKANMLRQEAKIAELLKSIELERLKKHRPVDYCTMCDLNFHGHISAHRKSEGHLLLKKFLHPRCIECNKEFPTRIDYDTHLLSPDHLRKAAEKNVRLGETKPKTLPINTEEQELKDVRPPQRKKKSSGKKASGDGEGESNADAEVKKEGEDGENADHKDEDGGDGDNTADETKEGDEMNESGTQPADGEEEEEVALPVDPEDVILDFNDGDLIPVDVDKRLPKYNWTRPVGTKLISKLDCFECCLCGKYFDTDKTAEIHSRTTTHHRNFLKFINEKATFTKCAQKRAAAALEENERKKRKLDDPATVKTEGEEEVKQEPNESQDHDEEMAENGEAETNEGGEGDGEGEAENHEYDENEEDLLLEGADEDGENGGDAELEEEQQEENEPEPEPEPEPVKEEPKKVETPKTPAKPAETTSPVKATPGRNQGKGAATPRNRGRGRYARY